MGKKLYICMMLNPKQEKFCREYVVDFNGTQAAIRAGYSKKTANEQAARLLVNVSIQDFIKTLQDEQAKELEITAAEITLNIKAIADRCMQGEQVFDSKGIPTGEWKFESFAALKAYELLGKRVGYFEKDNNQKGVKFKVSVGK